MVERTLATTVTSIGRSLLIVLPLLVLLLLIQPGWVTFAAVLLLCLLVPLFLLNEVWALTLVLIIRPSIDILGEQHIVEVANVPLNLSSVLSLLLIAWAITRLVNKPTAPWRRPLFWPLLLFVVALIPGSFTTIELTSTVRELLRIGSMILFYFLTFEIISERHNRRPFLLAITLSLVTPMVVALVQYVTHTGLDFGGAENRVYGTFGHPNVLGFYLVLSIAIFAGFLSDMNRAWRQRAVVGLAPLVLVLLLTSTRGAWLGLVILFATLGVFYARKWLVTALIIVVSLMFFGPAINRLSMETVGIDLDRFPVVARVIDRHSDESSLEWRFKLWSEMRYKADERPLFGHGLGVFPILREQRVRGYFEGTEAHNDYLRLAVETGMLGLAAYLVLILALLRAAIRRIMWATSQSAKLKAVALLGFLLAFIVMSLFDNLLQATAVMWAFWSFVAVVLSQTGKRQVEAQSSQAAP